MVPAFNEAGNVALLVEELAPAAIELNAEILVVDDGSTDGTADLVPRAAPFRCIRTPRAGKTAALSTGFRQARGEFIATIDADLQEDPQHLATMITMLETYDCVLGVRAVRTDSLVGKRLPSWIYNRLIGLMFGMHFRDINCGLRAFRRSALRHLVYYDDAHRIFPLMVHVAGGRVGLLPVRHRPRRFEQPKFSSPSRFAPAMIELVRMKRLTR